MIGITSWDIFRAYTIQYWAHLLDAGLGAFAQASTISGDGWRPDRGVNVALSLSN